MCGHRAAARPHRPAHIGAATSSGSRTPERSCCLTAGRWSGSPGATPRIDLRASRDAARSAHLGGHTSRRVAGPGARLPTSRSRSWSSPTDTGLIATGATVSLALALLAGAAARRTTAGKGEVRDADQVARPGRRQVHDRLDHAASRAPRIGKPLAASPPGRHRRARPARRAAGKEGTCARASASERR